MLGCKALSRCSAWFLVFFLKLRLCFNVHHFPLVETRFCWHFHLIRLCLFYTPVLHLSRWRGISNKTCLMDFIVQASAWQLLLRGFFWLGSQKTSVLNRERFNEFKIKKTKKEEIPHDCCIVGSWIHSTLQEMQTTDELDFNHLPLSRSKGAAEPHLAFHFSSLLRNRIRNEAFCGGRLDERHIRRHQTEQGSTKILCSSSFSGEVLLEASRWEWKRACPGDSSSWMRNLISVLKIQRQKVEEMLKLQIEWWWFGSCACIKIQSPVHDVTEGEDSGVVQLPGIEVVKGEEFRYLASIGQSNGECTRRECKQLGMDGWRRSSGVIWDRRVKRKV